MATACRRTEIALAMVVAFAAFGAPRGTVRILAQAAESTPPSHPDSPAKALTAGGAVPTSSFSEKPQRPETAGSRPTPPSQDAEGRSAASDTRSEGATIVPGVSVGSITAATTEKELRASFGRANVRTKAGLVQDGDEEGFRDKQTVLFPNKPERRLTIVWADSKRLARPARIYLGWEVHGEDVRHSEWRTEEGIGTRTTLKDLEALNGRQFSVLQDPTGESLDRVSNWRGGRLATLAGRLLISLCDLKNPTRKLSEAELKAEGEKQFDEAQASEDGGVSSGSYVREVGVCQLRVLFPENEKTFMERKNKEEATAAEKQRAEAERLAEAQQQASDSQQTESEPKETTAPMINRKAAASTLLGVSEKTLIARLGSQPDSAGSTPPDSDGISLAKLHWGPTHGIGYSAQRIAFARGTVDAWFLRGKLINMKMYPGGYNAYAPIDFSRLKTIRSLASWASERPTKVGTCFDALLAGVTVTRFEWRYSDLQLDICAITDYPESAYDPKVQQKVMRQVSRAYSQDLKVLWMGIASPDWKRSSRK